MKPKIITSLAFIFLGANLFSADSQGEHAKRSAMPNDLPRPGPQRVAVTGGLAYNGDESRPSSAWFMLRVQEGNALELVQRWPDLALDVLRESFTAEDLAPRAIVAQAYDRAFAQASSPLQWSAVLEQLTARRASFAKYTQTRDRIQTLLQAGQFAEAVKLDSGAALPGDAPAILRAEAARLSGLAWLLNDRPDKTTELFSRTLGGIRELPRPLQFDLGLLLSETERRRGRTDAATAAWKAAVAAGGGAKAVRDPELWERAIFEKDMNTTWPLESAIVGSGEPEFIAHGLPETADVLIGIGKMRFARGSHQAALLAFSRAESETVVDGKKALARLYRVQSMVALKQSASALAMLDTLTGAGDPRITRRAQALKGDLLCREFKDRRHGVPLLRAALDRADGGDWPGKTRLAANLALYDILEGRQDEGLRRLHRVEAAFELAEQWQDWAEALRNEAAFLRTAEKMDEAAELERRANAPGRKVEAKTQSPVEKATLITPDDLYRQQ